MLGGTPIDLKRLSYFVMVADELHFGRAAARLFISQPALSKQIKVLEKSLGVELFVRGAGGVTLTAQGQGLLPEARLLLDAAEQLVEQAHSSSRSSEGLISLGYHEVALGSIVPTFLKALLAAAPGVSVTLTSFPLGPAALTGLIDGRCDVVIMSKTTRDVAGLRSEPLATEELMAAVPAGHRLSRLPLVPMVELAAEPFAFFYRDGNPEGWDDFMTFFDEAGRRPTIEHEGERIQEALLWVGSGQGVTLVPAAFARVAVYTDVVFRPLTDPTPTQHIVLAWIEPNANPRLAVAAAAAASARAELDGSPGLVG